MHTQALIDFVTGAMSRELPASALDAAKLHTLDTLGVDGRKRGRSKYGAKRGK